jgi:L-cysteine S-thiosulfotransferase
VAAPVTSLVLLVWLLLASASALAQTTGAVSYKVEGDAIRHPLGGLTGDAARGRVIVATRQKGLCLLCHSGPFPEERFQGDLAPSLAGAGSRSSEGQLRLRMVDSRSVNRESLMPAYHRTDALTRVAPGFADKPVLSAQEIEDVVAFLMTLKE